MPSKLRVYCIYGLAQIEVQSTRQIGVAEIQRNVYDQCENEASAHGARHHSRLGGAAAAVRQDGMSEAEIAGVCHLRDCRGGDALPDVIHEQQLRHAYVINRFISVPL